MGRDAFDRHRAAPRELAGEHRAVGADGVLAHHRLDAVGADHEIGLPWRALFERHRHAIVALAQRGGASAEHQRLRVERGHRCAQRIVQIAPVQLKVRRAVALLVLLAQRQAVQQLAVVEAAELERLGPHRQRLESGAQIEPIEHLHRVGAHLDACTDLAEHRRLLGHAHAMAALQQRGRSGQPAEAGADDRDVQARRHGYASGASQGVHISRP